MSVTDVDGAVRTSVAIPFMILSTILVALRYQVRLRMTGSIGFDDLFATIAWVMLIAQSFMELYDSNEILQSTQHPTGQAFSVLPTINLLYIVTTGCIRLAIVCFLPQNNRIYILELLASSLAFTIIIQTITCFFIYAFACKHISDLWSISNASRVCLSAHHQSFIFWAQSMSGVAIDLILLMLATWSMFFNKDILTRNVKAIPILLISAFVLTTGVLQLVQLMSRDLTGELEINTMSIWSTLQMHIGLWTACLPILWPLSDLFSSKLVLEESDFLQSELKDPILSRNRLPPPIKIPTRPRIGIAINDIERGPNSDGSDCRGRREESGLASALTNRALIESFDGE